MDVYFARQPIFDRSRALAGYELLYRAHPDSEEASGSTHEQMALRVLVDAMLSVGVHTAAAGHPAYINVSRELLLSGPFDMLDPRSLVIEILESVPPDAEVEQAVRKLVQSRYVLALDDYAADDARAPLAPLVHVLKVDVLGLDRTQIQQLARLRQRYPATLLAERVETEEVFRTCLDEGFGLFQGYFFQRPEMVRRADLAPTQLQIIELLNMLHDPERSDNEIENVFRSDVALSYKLLRMANSAEVGMRWVESIGHAIRILGRHSMHRWLVLLLAASVPRNDGTATELLLIALTRARLCELLLQRNQPRLAASGFLVGVCSLLDAILRVPLDAVVERLTLAPVARAALLDRAGPIGAALQLAIAYESADWDDVHQLLPDVGVQAGELIDAYTRSLEWAGSRIAAL